MKDKLEAILFAAGKYVDEEHLAKLVAGDIRTVRKQLALLKEAYDKRGDETCLQVVQEGASWKLHVKDAYLDLVSKLVSDKEIATTVLETLAIVAWRNPAMQAELIKIRGPAAYEHVAELLERGFITKEAEGRSFKLKVTDKFYEYFDIEHREDLQKLFKNVDDKARSAQAEIDQAQSDYDSQKAAADAAAQALAEGKDAPTADVFKRENSAPASSAHSAQEKVAGLIDEAKVALNTAKPSTPNPAETMSAMKEELAAMEEDIAQLKDVATSAAEKTEKHHTHHPTHKHAHPAKHHKK